MKSFSITLLVTFLISLTLSSFKSHTRVNDEDYDTLTGATHREYVPLSAR